MYEYRYFEERSCNYCRIGKTINIIYFAGIFAALGIQHAMYMCRIILLSVACPDLHYFSTLSHKRYEFFKKVIEHKMRVLIFSTTFLRNISRSKKE